MELQTEIAGHQVYLIWKTTESKQKQKHGVMVMIGSKMSRNHPQWKLILLLIEITAHVMSPNITNGLCIYLKRIIEEHHELFKELFSNTCITLKPKLLPIVA